MVLYACPQYTPYGMRRSFALSVSYPVAFAPDRATLVGGRAPAGIGGLRCKKQRPIPLEIDRSSEPLSWCGGGDSNPHSFRATRSLVLRVYQFRHPRTTNLLYPQGGQRQGGS